jgi:hypothetical protein
MTVFEDNAELLLDLLFGDNPALRQGSLPVSRAIPVYNGGSRLWDATAVPSAFGLQPVHITANVAEGVPWDLYLADATGGDITIALPNPALAMGFNYPQVGVKLLSATGTVTLLPFAAETIEGGASLVLDAQYASALVVTDQTNWWKVGL